MFKMNTIDRPLWPSLNLAEYLIYIKRNLLLVRYFFVCIFATLKVEKNASVAELVDALDSESCSFGSAGSIRPEVQKP